MRVLALLCGLLYAAIGCAQPPEVQRALIQRDQQSDEFSQQLRQSQEQLRVPPGDLRKEPKTDASQLEERQRLQNLNTQQQQQSVEPGTPEVLRPYERQKAADERREFVLPPTVP